MKGLVICDKGFEAECASEIVSLVDVSHIVEKSSCCLFDVKSLYDLAFLGYRSLSAVKVLHFISSVPYTPDFLELISVFGADDWIAKDTTFKVVVATDVDKEQSYEYASEVGGKIIDAYPSLRVDVKDPDIIFLLYIQDGEVYLGLDLTHSVLYKREYKMFHLSKSLRSTVAHDLVLFSGFKPGMKLLDPFCGGGTISIEAALFELSRSPHFFLKEKFPYSRFAWFKKDQAQFLSDIDKKIKTDVTEIYGFDILSKHVDSCKKNSKIAGIVKQIHFSKVEVDWMDLKLDGVDRIVTYPPLFSAHVDDKAVLRSYSQLFHRAQLVLKKNGCIALLTNSAASVSAVIPKEYALVSSRQVFMGQQEYSALLIKRKKEGK